MQCNVGQVIEGKVCAIKPYGMFIEFNDTVGFCHISNVSNKFVVNISDVYHINQEVKAKVIQMDSGRINLSIKALDSDMVQKTSNSIQNKSNHRGNINHNTNRQMSFDDMLKQYMNASDEQLKSISRRTKKHTKR